MTEIDVLFNENDLSSDNGTITFDKDISPVKTILPDKDSKISDLRDRFYELNDLIKNKIEESKNLSKKYSLDLNKPISEKEVAAQDLQILYSEKK